MRPQGWLALTAYGITLCAGVALAVQHGSGTAVPAIAPIGGYVRTPVPPAWAFIRLTPRTGQAAPAVPAFLQALGGAVVFILGGYDPSAAGAVRAALPGWPAPSGSGGALGPQGAVGE